MKTNITKEKRKELHSAFSKVLRVVKRHTKANDDLNDILMDVYGYTYSDIDADGIIDPLVYGSGEITCKEFLRMMDE